MGIQEFLPAQKPDGTGGENQSDCNVSGFVRWENKGEFHDVDGGYSNGGL